MDVDQLGMMEVLANGYDFSENGQGLEAIREVGPGSHFLGCTHTQKNFETAFWTSTVSDNKTFEQWSAEGEATQMERAAEIAKKMLDNYNSPEIDQSKDDELREFIDKKMEELPDSEV